MADAVALKDQLFHATNIRRLADELAAVDTTFDADGFTDAVVSRLPDLELKQRISWIATCLAERLPDDFGLAVEVLIASLPAPCDPDRTDGDFGDFIYAPHSRFVADHGCSEERFDVSLHALRQMTTRFSAEDAIRPFIAAFPDRTFTVLREWCDDPHYHVRRLCSEGTRPRLPWSARLPTPVDAAVPILDALHADSTRFVTRSVANHVNDIAKDDADLAIDLLTRWLADGRQNPTELAYIVRHATRGLVKAGHPGALALRGIDVDVPVMVEEFRVAPTVALGDRVEFAVRLLAPVGTLLLVDYEITFPGRSGRTGKKIYKLTQCRVGEGGTVELVHRHRLRPGMTTRTIVAGRHHLAVQVNGRIVATGSFEVTTPT